VIIKINTIFAFMVMSLIFDDKHDFTVTYFFVNVKFFPYEHAKDQKLKFTTFFMLQNIHHALKFYCHKAK